MLGRVVDDTGDSLLRHISGAVEFGKLAKQWNRRALGKHSAPNKITEFEGAQLMSEPFLAEVRIYGFNFNPRGWATCDGQILPIAQNQSLYSLLGTTFGGDGRTTFALPELRGRSPRGVGSATTHGQRSGSENNTLTTAEIPSHRHTVRASNAAQDLAVPTDALPAVAGGGRRPIVPYGGGSNLTQMAATANNSPANQAVNNMQPFLALNFCIALQGVFPSRN